MAVDNDTRKRNQLWTTFKTDGGNGRYHDSIFYQYASLAVLMDIRDELQSLNRLLSCTNFLSIPASLRTIVANTTKRKYTRRTQK